MAKVEAAVKTDSSERLARFWSTLGPGLLWAAAAIGVSHLVQSTRAGADGGFSLIWVVLAALAFKYPFFEYGPRYAAATGESLVEGYFRLGRWAVWLYVFITLASALIIQAAVALFTTFLFAQVLGVDWSIATLGAVVLSGCALLLWIGRFQALDRTIKAVLIVLAICTMIAATSTLPRVPEAIFTPWPLADTPAIRWVFILALVGWMPSAIDIAVWSSLWTLAKDQATGVKATVDEALLDFRIGYVGTGIIALAFLTLGATVMYAADTRFSPEGAAFSLQLVDLYAQTLGAWARPIILIAVLTTMFSTTLTVMDGFPRAIARSFRTLRHGLEEWPAREQVGPGYWITLVVLGVGTVIVFAYFVGNLTTMVDFATLLAFVTAPVLGYLNLRTVTLPNVPEPFQPGPRLRAFSYVGLTVMGGIAFIFVGSLILR
jgi:Mn2+/Fe2+ NRAMP family transporter